MIQSICGRYPAMCFLDRVSEINGMDDGYAQNSFIGNIILFNGLCRGAQNRI